MDGFVDRLHALRFLRACDPSYRALTFPLVGLPPTEHISLLLDILSGSFLPSLGRRTTTVYSGRGSQHCYEIKWSSSTLNGRRRCATAVLTAATKVVSSVVRFGAPVRYHSTLPKNLTAADLPNG
jgi:hypothetical protein